MTLAELAARVGAAMAAGRPIAELNRLRGALSAIKGGRLAAACPAPVDHAGRVGRGRRRPGGGRQRARRWGRATRRIAPGAAIAVAPGPGAGPGGDRPRDAACVVAGVADLAAAAVDAAAAAGLDAGVLAADVTGDVADVAARLAAAARAPGPALWVAAGEPTVALPPAPGQGGRAAQLGLLVARALAGAPGWTLLVAGSDGVDGTGPAAGAVVDGATWAALAAAGIDGDRALAACDAGAALAGIGAAVVTGPTGVNHCDLMLVAPRRARRAVVRTRVGWTTLDVLDWTAKKFAARGIESARLEAQLLVAHALGCSRVELYTAFDKPLTEADLAPARELIRRRLAGEPVAYLIGEQEFWSLPFTVDRSVLIPRRDTETVIELVLAEVGARGRALRGLDVATGSGVLAVTLARELPASRWLATESHPRPRRSPAATPSATAVADRVEVRVGDLAAPVAGEPRFDLVVSNPPYVRTLGHRRPGGRGPGRAPAGARRRRRRPRPASGAWPRCCPSGRARRAGRDRARLRSGRRVRALLDATGALSPGRDPRRPRRTARV